MGVSLLVAICIFTILDVHNTYAEKNSIDNRSKSILAALGDKQYGIPSAKASENNENPNTDTIILGERKILTFEEVEKKVKPMVVIAEINKNTSYYSSYYQTKRNIGSLKVGAQVEIIEDRSTQWYRIKILETGKIGWISHQYLTIPKEEPVIKDKMSTIEIEIYVNGLNLKSDTSYFIWTDISRQLVHVFQRYDGRWRLEKSFICATGLNESPTTRGVFKTSERGEWFFSERFNAGAKYWLRFNGDYLFHSVSMDRHQNITDLTLGTPVSSGCIRLSVEDAKWLYSYIPAKTTVYIY